MRPLQDVRARPLDVHHVFVIRCRTREVIRKVHQCKEGCAPGGRVRGIWVSVRDWRRKIHDVLTSIDDYFRNVNLLGFVVRACGLG